MLTRTAALSILMALTLPACDSKTEPGDDAGDEQGTAEEGESAEEASAEDGESAEESAEDGEEPPPVVEDFGREGETCDQSVLSAACQTGMVAGLEFCDYDAYTWEYQWTACLTETCSEAGKERACEGGFAYCGTHAEGPDSDVLYWGPCGEKSVCEPGEVQDCGFGEEQMITQSCTVDQYGRHIWNADDCNTPLVLSFGAEIEYSAATTMAAEFDMHGGAGTCARADWPTAQSPWLALDRDGNGGIDGAHELFGSATRLSAGAVPHNGFQALAELDSDADGKISVSDARWGELVLWADHDADRRSSGWEMLPLASFEIVEIDLGYQVRRDCDERGNCGLERAQFVYRTNGREQVGEVVDVRVACE